MQRDPEQAVADTAPRHGSPDEGPVETDAVIVGAGPVGLFQVFELGLLEIKAHIIDSLAYPGGQCIELYPDKPIYDIPAVPMCTGKELTDNLLKQIEPFGATFHLGQEVVGLQKQDDGRFHVTTSKGTRFLTKTVFIAGGVESMSRAPLVLSKAQTAYDREQELVDTSLGWRFVNPRLAAMHHPYSMGQTAENVARAHRISREDQDRFALASQKKWGAANQNGRFADELVPVEIPQRKGEKVVVSVDEHPRPDTTPEQLAKLRPVFVAEGEAGTVTAGNSSGVNDGAAALLLVEAGRAAALGLKPIALIGASASAGVDPAQMGIGPVPAVRKALTRAGVSLKDIGLVELNEAFAAQSLACIRELGLDESLVNVNGGAIAMGHPLGCSGARIATTLIHEMARRGVNRGVASLCVGVGQGLATVFKRA